MENINWESVSPYILYCNLSPSFNQREEVRGEGQEREYTYQNRYGPPIMKTRVCNQQTKGDEWPQTPDVYS
ncbi:hypothetical protein PRBRB14_03990 [Hallella multisaccharivorax DSM 17128]|nr:hypothetical protein PRBRB14_03990 [Hallella multisaccharivorax DSM 17128]